MVFCCFRCIAVQLFIEGGTFCALFSSNANKGVARHALQESMAEQRLERRAEIGVKIMNTTDG